MGISVLSNNLIFSSSKKIVFRRLALQMFKNEFDIIHTYNTRNRNELRPAFKQSTRTEIRILCFLSVHVWNYAWENIPTDVYLLWFISIDIVILINIILRYVYIYIYYFCRIFLEYIFFL